MIKSKKGMIVPLILGLIVIALIAVIFISGLSVRTAEKAFAKANEGLAEEEGFGPAISEELLGKTLYLHQIGDWDILIQAAVECYQKCKSNKQRAIFCNYIDTSGIFIPFLRDKLESINPLIDPKTKQHYKDYTWFVLTQFEINKSKENYMKGNLEMCCTHAHVIISQIGSCFDMVKKKILYGYEKPQIP